MSWSTANGTALAGSDFSPRSGQVVFAPGQTSRTVTVPVIGDTSVEADETFRVQRAQPKGAMNAAREDLGRALDHVVARAAAYGVDASRVAVGGGSSGSPKCVRG